MKDLDGLRAAFAAAGVDVARPVITTCGSGISAAILSLALERLGNRCARALRRRPGRNGAPTPI